MFWALQYCFPCRWPEVSKISIWISASVFRLFIRCKFSAVIYIILEIEYNNSCLPHCCALKGHFFIITMILHFNFFTQLPLKQFFCNLLMVLYSNFWTFFYWEAYIFSFCLCQKQSVSTYHERVWVIFFIWTGCYLALVCCAHKFKLQLRINSLLFLC